MNIYQRAIDAFGGTNQMHKTGEECAELIVALSHLLDGRVSSLEVAREIADVEIMLAQMREIIGDDLVDMEKEVKLRRLEQKLKILDKLEKS